MSDEEDDYMNMSFSDPSTTAPLSSLQKEAARRKANELKGRPKSKLELEAEAKKARDAALATSTLDPSNKGAKLMAKLGFKGGALGRSGEGGRTEPIELAMKADRGGIGMDSEKKRKMREEMEERVGREKRVKAEEGEYVDRIRKEREDKRLEGQLWGAMKVAEKLDTEAEEERESNAVIEGRSKGTEKDVRLVNVLWRNLARQQMEREREKRIRKEYQERLDGLPGVRDREEDADDKLAMGTEIEELEDDEEDEELDEFNALELPIKLQKLIDHLRSAHNYCFWCKYRYPDADMEGCPGVTEEDHD